MSVHQKYFGSTKGSEEIDTCRNGHFYSPENTKRDKYGYRQCKACDTEAKRRQRDRKAVVNGEVRRFTKLMQPMEWMDLAACRNLDVNIFFVERGDSSKEAQAICADCSVKAACLNYALTNNEEHGIWGGLSGRKRRTIKRLKATA